MRPPFDPSTVPLEFITWVACFAVCRAVQRGLCRRYPGIRSVCRVVYLATALLAVLPAAWALATGGHTAHLLAAVNHAFGIGVFMQTALRSLLMVVWVAWSGPHALAAMAAGTPLFGMRTEAELLVMLVALTAALRPEADPEIEPRA
jgi:hypothetical protein